MTEKMQRTPSAPCRMVGPNRVLILPEKQHTAIMLAGGVHPGGADEPARHHARPPGQHMPGTGSESGRKPPQDKLC